MPRSGTKDLERSTTVHCFSNPLSNLELFVLLEGDILHQTIRMTLSLRMLESAIVRAHLHMVHGRSLVLDFHYS